MPHGLSTADGISVADSQVQTRFTHLALIPEHIQGDTEAADDVQIPTRNTTAARILGYSTAIIDDAYLATANGHKGVDAPEFCKEKETEICAKRSTVYFTRRSNCGS